MPYPNIYQNPNQRFLTIGNQKYAAPSQVTLPTYTGGAEGLAAGGTGVVPGGLAPMKMMDPMSIAGVASSGLGAITGAIGGLMEDKGKTTAAMHTQAKTAIPQRAMVPMTPEQLQMFKYFMGNLQKQQMSYDQGTSAPQQFAKNLNFTGNAVLGIKDRIAAYKAKYSGGA